MLINLREVGVPSRNILHVRGRRPKSRIRVRGRREGAGACKRMWKVKDSINTANFALLRDPLLLGPGMRVPSGEQVFHVVRQKNMKKNKNQRSLRVGE